MEELAAGVGDHARQSVVVHLLPVHGESRGGHVSDGCQVDGLHGDRGADADQLQYCVEEHGDEAGLAHPSRAVDQELFVAVQNVALLEGSLQDIAGICDISECGVCIHIILTCTVFPTGLNQDWMFVVMRDLLLLNKL